MAASAPSFGAHTNAEFGQASNGRGIDKSDQDYTENTYDATDFFGERGNGTENL
jgi:hypothetical protein